MQNQHFKDLPLSSEVLKGIEELGFNNLFPIQAEAIIPMLKGKDVIGQAKTGTGKTAAFGIPILECLNPNVRNVQGLVLDPTRELAQQVAEHISRLGKYIGVKATPIYGGTSIQRQIEALNKGVQVVVGTPGRLIDHIKRGVLDLSKARIVVLDEADRMLDMGFIEDIEYILSKTPVDRQTALFSATIDETVMSVCHKYMKNPEKIIVSKDEIAPLQIDQHYMIVNPANKFRVLCRILERNQVERAILFCRTRRYTDILADRLKRRGYDAMPLHAGFTQPQRDSVINSFRKGKLKLLVATDVAARGLDIQGISHIINYDVPLDALVYFHRIGRTARVGEDGTAITLVGYGELTQFNRIKSLTKTTIEEVELSIQGW